MPVINFSLRLLFLLALLLPLAIGPATAQVPATPAAAPATISAADLEAALATLTNDDQREKLVAQLRSLAEARRAVQPATVARPFGAQIFDQLSERLTSLGAQIVAVGSYSVDIPDTWEWIETQFADPDKRREWLAILLEVVAAVGAGILVEAGVRRLLQRPRRAIETRETERPLIRFVLLLVRTLLEMVPVLAFAAAGYAVLSFMAMSGSARVAALAIVNANVLTRLVVALAKMVLSPEVPSLRFVGISDVAAARMFRQFRRLTAIGVYGYFLIRVLYILGISTAAYVLLLKLLGIVVAAFLIQMILRDRGRVADKLRGRGHDDSGNRTLRSRLADLWHVLAIVYVVAICVTWVMQVDEGFSFIFRATLLSIVILVAARIAVTLADQGLRRGFPVGAELHEAFPTLQHNANRYAPMVRRVILGVIWAAAAAGLLWAWNVPVSDLAGRELFGAALRIGLLVGVAIAIWEMLRAGLTRVMRRPGVNGVAQPSARARTLIPLIEKFSFIVLVIIVGLMVLAEVGVDIAPLLAGAGIIGIAVGFGAQSLVKDVITGLFILLEDQFSVGDVVNVAGKGGLVEDISLRTIRLRDYDGTLFIIPYSEVGTTANLTKGFSYYVFNVGVSYREDVDEVIRVLRGLGEEMEQDPEFGPLMMAPLDIAGLDKFDDSAVIIKCRMKTLPIKQWTVGREFNRRMKKRFDELGIEIPFPHQTIYFGVDREGKAPPVHVAVEKLPVAPEEPVVAPEEPPGAAEEPAVAAAPADAAEHDGGAPKEMPGARLPG